MIDQAQPDYTAHVNAQVLDNIATPNRVMAPFWWYGGKGNMAKRILPHIPPGHPYVEPFAGAASLFWHMDPSRPVEVLNDLHAEIVNLFRVLQDREQFQELAHRLIWTPYSRDEFAKAFGNADQGSDVDRAWSFFVRQNQGFSGRAKTIGCWGRAVGDSRRGMASIASKWRSRLKLLDRWHDRLTRVQVDNRDAVDCIRYWDTPETVFYVDPPYVAATRKSKNDYQHEYTDAQHAELVDCLLTIDGQAVVSGYACEAYLPLEREGWQRIDIQTACHAAVRARNSGLQGTGAALAKAPRTETLWIKRRESSGGGLF